MRQLSTFRLSEPSDSVRSQIAEARSQSSVAANKRRGGRNGKPVYSPELAAIICERVSNGETLRAICRDPAIGVTESAVRHWYVTDLDGFAARFAHARECQAEAWSDELLEIADNECLEPNDRRVKLDTRKWLMSKQHPRRYGDKVVHAGDPDSPIKHLVGMVALNKLSDVELDALERFCQARLTATAVIEQADEGGV